MKDRIEKIINHYQLSLAEFSDQIGVPRSSLSHIFSGRNKPSLDFILKILSHFPEIKTDWLLLGKGSMHNDFQNDRKSTLSPTLFDVKEKKNDETKILPSKHIKSKPLEQGSSSKFETLLLLNENGTFKVYSNESRSNDD